MKAFVLGAGCLIAMLALLTGCSKQVKDKHLTSLSVNIKASSFKAISDCDVCVYDLLNHQRCTLWVQTTTGIMLSGDDRYEEVETVIKTVDSLDHGCVMKSF